MTLRYLTRTILSWLEPFRGSERAASRVARSVALAFVGALSIGASPADSSSIQPLDPKRYIRFNYDSSEALCLIKLYGKESAFKRDAIGNLSSPSKSYVYGIPQLKNPIIQHLSAIEQIDYGMKYIAHRYDGLPCRAWKHWQDKGWH